MLPQIKPQYESITLSNVSLFALPIAKAKRLGVYSVVDRGAYWYLEDEYWGRRAQSSKGFRALAAKT
jgi:hypothetical protein